MVGPSPVPAPVTQWQQTQKDDYERGQFENVLIQCEILMRSIQGKEFANDFSPRLRDEVKTARRQ